MRYKIKPKTGPCEKIRAIMEEYRAIERIQKQRAAANKDPLAKLKFLNMMWENSLHKNAEHDKREAAKQNLLEELGCSNTPKQ